MRHLAIAALFCFSALADDGSIAGRVINSVTNAPVRKATVDLHRSSGTPSLAVVTDTDAAGAFQFTGLPPGIYG